MSSERKLPPLDLSEDIQKYQAKEEQVDISQKTKCKHKNLTLGEGFIRCACGMEWAGPRLNELYNLLMERD